MSNGLRILMLLTDGFGGFGGIAKFNRDFLTALDACVLVERVRALPRVITEAIKEVIPESIVYDRGAACGKAAFVWRLIAHARYDQRVNLVVCGHLNLLPAAWCYARLSGARLAAIIHGVEAWVPRNDLVHPLIRTVDAYIAVSRHTAEKFSSWSQVSMDRIFILPNCVDLDRFQPQERDMRLVYRYGLCSSKVILTVGRLATDERLKGFDQVIEAMPQLLERFRTLKYLIIGDGDDRRRLEAKARTLGISEQVVFTGRISESEKVAYYNLADAYVMPSSGEGFGIVLIEAAACGIPVIGSRTDGSREALLDGRLGHLIDPARPNELIEAVTAVLAHECPPGRIALIETFSVKNFMARVAAWLRAQAIAYDSARYAQDDISPVPGVD